MKRSLSILGLSVLLFSACSSQLAVSPTPTETLKEFFAAGKARDAAKIRQTISKKSVRSIEKYLENGVTLEDAVKKDPSVLPPLYESSEIKNEKIAGDKATLEVKSPTTGVWIEVPFIKEDGRWKVAFGEQLESLGEKFKAVDDEMKKSGKQ